MIRNFLILFACFFGLSAFAQTNPLGQNFKSPPLSYRPGCYYYWINNNISVSEVTQDIAAMADVGIGRAFIGNVGFLEQEMSSAR